MPPMTNPLAGAHEHTGADITFSTQILQDIYASELNIAIGWFWDAGMYFGLGDDANGWKAEMDGFYDFNEGLKWLMERIFEHYPDSEFTKKYGRP